MTTLNDRYHERSHKQQVSEIIATVSDTETVIEMQALASQYQRIRHSLLVAISEIDALDSDYCTEHMDIVHAVAQIISGFRSEELSMHDMITAGFGFDFGDDTETEEF